MSRREVSLRCGADKVGGVAVRDDVRDVLGVQLVGRCVCGKDRVFEDELRLGSAASDSRGSGLSCREVFRMFNGAT
jgi:hypothetical protein